MLSFFYIFANLTGLWILGSHKPYVSYKIIQLKVDILQYTAKYSSGIQQEYTQLWGVFQEMTLGWQSEEIRDEKISHSLWLPGEVYLPESQEVNLSQCSFVFVICLRYACDMFAWEGEDVVFLHIICFFCNHYEWISGIWMFPAISVFLRYFSELCTQVYSTDFMIKLMYQLFSFGCVTGWYIAI